MDSATGRKKALLGLILLLPVLAFTTIGPLIAPDPLAINVQEALQEPSPRHLLGTDILGRDVFARLAEGGRNSMLISLAALGISVLTGLFLGFFAGWFGGLAEAVFDRLIEAIICIPGIMLALLLVIFMGRGPTSLIVALALTGAVYVARIVKGEVQLIKSNGFVEAALLYGIPRYRVLIGHMLPNFLGPLVACSVILLGSNILSESALSFLGLGVQPPAPSWGGMLYEARNLWSSNPLLSVAPGVAIFMVVLGFNLLAEGLPLVWRKQARIEVRAVERGGAGFDRDAVNS